MPVHLSQRERSEQWFCALRKLDGPDMAGFPLHLQLGDTENPVVMSDPVGGISANLTQRFKAQAFNQLRWEGQLDRSCVRQRLTRYFFAPPLCRQVSVLSIPDFHRNPKYTHASLITDSAHWRYR